jgi:hypothetical protein
LLYIALRSDENKNKNLVLLFISLTVSFLVCEIFVRYTAKGPWITLRTVKEMRKNGTHVYPLINPIGSNLHRLNPIPKVETLLGEEGYGWITYFSDENGFRNPNDLYNSSEKIEIFAVGDSYCIGRDVPNSDNWSVVLRDIAGRSVYNAGISAASSLHELAILLKYGVPKRPKVVLWLYYDNDILALNKEMHNEYLSKCLLLPERGVFALQPGCGEHAMSDEALKAWFDKGLADPIRMGMHGEDFRKKPLIRMLRLHSRFIDKLIEMTDEQVLYHEEMLQACQESGTALKRILLSAKQSVAPFDGEVLFVYLPQWAHWVPEYSDTFDLVRNEVVSLAQEAGLPVLDMKQRFDHYGDVYEMYSGGKKGGHFSIKGYRILAQEIYKDIVDHHRLH